VLVGFSFSGTDVNSNVARCRVGRNKGLLSKHGAHSVMEHYGPDVVRRLGSIGWLSILTVTFRPARLLVGDLGDVGFDLSGPRSGFSLV